MQKLGKSWVRNPVALVVSLPCSAAPGIESAPREATPPRFVGNEKAGSGDHHTHQAVQITNTCTAYFFLHVLAMNHKLQVSSSENPLCLVPICLISAPEIWNSHA